MADLTGQNLGGRYRVETFLGRGGMSEVYKVFDVQRAVYLAMKVLNENLANDQVFMRRFLQEAQTLEMLQHPNIVRYYGLVKAGGYAFILMDFIDGLTLRKEIGLKQKTMTPERVLEIIQPVCAALYYAHQMGMVHCDIKPANIMIHRNGGVYLADFGIARMTAATTQTPTRVGTPAYMAPEDLSGQQPTPSADIYSLGVVLYEMLTGGKRPFTGESAETTGSITKKIIWEKQHRAAPPLSQFNQAVSPALEAVVMRCLERDPARRFSTTLDLLHALQSAVYGQVEEDEVSTQIDLPVEPAQEVTTHDRQGAAPRRLGAWVLVSAAALLLAAAALAGLPSAVQAPHITATAPRQAAQATVVMNASTSTLTAGAASTPTAGPAGSATAVMNAPALESTPTLLPTPTGGSQKIAFASDRGDSIQIWTIDILNPDDRPAQVTNQPGGACQPTWSPDGTRLAFTTPCRGPSVFYPGSTIKIIDLKNRSVTDLLPRSAGAFDPDWSPDGKTIVYTAISGEETEVRAIDLGKEEPRLLADRGTKNAQPAWSRDGKFIAFISSDQRYRDALWLMRADGGSQELLAHDGPFSEPTWSPDHHTILLSILTNGFPNLVEFDRGNPTLGVVPFLPDTFRMSYSSISPDNRWVVFWTEDNHATPRIMLVNADSRQANPLFDSTSRDFQPAWAPR
jgi:serine/threonine protein kinase/Tol biopolymer transport system component